MRRHAESFAREFNDATLTYGEHTDRTPNFVITPTGAMCNRIFAVGVLTEVENIGTRGQTLYRARLADPTGAFTVYAGQYQQEAASFLSSAATPTYVAVSGKVRMYSPEPGASYTSIRPEEINVVDRSVRDRWIYHTAALTLDRIKVGGESAGQRVPRRRADLASDPARPMTRPACPGPSTTTSSRTTRCRLTSRW